MLDRIPLLPPYRIAIIGGGQLGKMMAVAAKQMGFFVSVLDPTPHSPAAQVADHQVVADFTDGEAFSALAKESDVMTYEFEHIDSLSLIALEEQGHAIFPTPKILRLIQNKMTQKETLLSAGIPLPPFEPVRCIEDLRKAASKFGYPLLLKASTGGYDGKGNYLLQKPEDIETGFALFDKRSVFAEKFVPFACEVSVVVARGRCGEIKSYPLSENEHIDNILHRSIVPAKVTDLIASKAQKVAEAVISVFSGIGVFCVEMFVTKSGEILVNEVAPRPHNSGHYTIEACEVSQFEQHIRAVTGLPLGNTTLRSPAVMVNILGKEPHDGPAVLEGCSSALSLPGVHLHFYGKKMTLPGRKMGHITVTASDLELALQTADSAMQKLRVITKDGDGVCNG